MIRKNSVVNADKVAILVDLDFFVRRLYKYLPFIKKLPPNQRAKECIQILYIHCMNHINYKKENNKLYRIFIYDCPPLSKKMHHPKKIDNKGSPLSIDFSKTDLYEFRTNLHAEAKKTPSTALRLGKLDEKNARWSIKNKDKYNKFIRGKIKFEDLNENDFFLDVSQKQVDMKIGIDIVWLTLKKLVDKIILISGDSDFVPASKLTRREGIIFILDPLKTKDVKEELLEHIDSLRTPPTFEKMALRFAVESVVFDNNDFATIVNPIIKKSFLENKRNTNFLAQYYGEIVVKAIKNLFNSHKNYNSISLNNIKELNLDEIRERCEEEYKEILFDSKTPEEAVERLNESMIKVKSDLLPSMK